LKSVLIDSDMLMEVSRAVTTPSWSDGTSLAAATPLLYVRWLPSQSYGTARPHEEKALRTMFAAVTGIAIDLEERGGDYLRQYEKSHSVELGDALIGATASSHKAHLWTRDQRHYPVKEIVFY
jgi:predicted nucleic acid-binding protein